MAYRKIARVSKGLGTKFGGPAVSKFAEEDESEHNGDEQKQPDPSDPVPDDAPDSGNDVPAGSAKDPGDEWGGW